MPSLEAKLRENLSEAPGGRRGGEDREEVQSWWGWGLKDQRPIAKATIEEVRAGLCLSLTRAPTEALPQPWPRLPSEVPGAERGTEVSGKAPDGPKVSLPQPAGASQSCVHRPCVCTEAASPTGEGEIAKLLSALKSKKL